MSVDDKPIEVGGGVTVRFNATGVVIENCPFSHDVPGYRRILEEAMEAYGKAVAQEYRRGEILKALTETYREAENRKPLSERKVNRILKKRVDVSSLPIGKGIRLTYVDGSLQGALLGVPNTLSGRPIDVIFKMPKQILFTEEQVLAAARAAVYTAVIHETQEHFRIDGQIVDYPHTADGGGDAIEQGLKALCQAYVGALFK